MRTVDVAAIQQAADEAAIAYRDVNAEIQAANWTVELTMRCESRHGPAAWERAGVTLPG